MGTKIMSLATVLLVGASVLLTSCESETVNPNIQYVDANSMNFQAVQAGNYISYSSAETCLGDPLTVVFNNGYSNNCGNAQIQMSVNGGVWTQVAQSSPSNGIISYTFTPTTEGSYLFRVKWNPTGGPSCSITGAAINWSVASFPAIVAACGCENSFEGEALDCDNTREATYTFTAEDDMDYIKIQGGLTNFTGEDAIVTVTGGDLTISQWTPGGSTNRVIKVEGSVSACETITIHITWNSTNNGGIITGNWSVKDSDGNNVADPVEGLECQ